MSNRPDDSGATYDEEFSKSVHDSSLELTERDRSEGEQERVTPPQPCRFEDTGLPDSHILGMPLLVPHHSDGTTDVLVRGRQVEDPEVSEATEPLFPRQSIAPPNPLPGDEAARPDPDIVSDETTRLPTQSMEAVREEIERTELLPDFAARQPAGQSSGATPLVADAAGGGSTSSRAESITRGPEKPRSNLTTLLLISYASAMTLAVIYLLIDRSRERVDRHQLEDLRDPQDEDGVVRIFSRDAELPAGHTLALGESRQFGNILIEPLRVTREPIEFVHYTGSTRQRQPNSPPVLKLWVRLTNKSAEQEIAPFDGLLLYKREMNTKGDLVANSFIAPVDSPVAGPVVFNFETSQASEWDMRGQELRAQAG
ncbi:MAG: hypothetical protein R3B90_15465 [Planctomycetaceae bacterium]